MSDNKQQADFSSRAGIVMTAAAWMLFLAFLFGVFDSLVSQQNNPNQNVATTYNGQQKEVILKRNNRGHYVTNGTINNHSVIFLLDTGATDIAIPEQVAIDIGLQKGHEVTIKTANGNAIAYRSQLDTVAIGEIKLHDLNATILSNITGKEILLGMNFLKHFEIIQKGKTLTIKQ